MLGFLPAMDATIHFIIVSSTHIGLCWGFPGSSGMQVQPLLPWRRTRPWASSFGSDGQSMTVACSPMIAGAALSAFLIFHSSECWLVVSVSRGSGSLTDYESGVGLCPVNANSAIVRTHPHLMVVSSDRRV